MLSLQQVSSGIKRFHIENLCDTKIYDENGIYKVKKNIII